MRFLFLAPFGRCAKQTVQRRLLPLARALAARGHEVIVLIPPWDCPHVRAGIQVDAGVQVRTLARGPGLAGLYPRLLAGMMRNVYATAPDVLVGSKGLGYAGLVMAAWLRRGGRVLLDVDDLEDERGWGAQRARWLQWALSRQERWLRVHVSGVVVASSFLLADGRRSAPEQQFLLLPNGLTPARQRARVEDNAAVALLMTRGNDVDAARLADVWRLVSDQVADAQLVVVGDWSDVPAQLPRVSVRGWLSGARLAHQVRAAACCFFLPPDNALVRAKSPARLLTCAAHGLPVLTLDVGAYGELARALGGTVVADVPALAAQMVTLLQQPALRARRSACVWQQAAAHDWAHRAQQFEIWVQRN